MFKEKLRNYITESYLDGQNDMLANDTQLLELNIVDSAAIFDLVDFIKEQTGIVVSMMEVNPANFSSINEVHALVNRLHTKGE
jgi:acyl carrier protein